MDLKEVRKKIEILRNKIRHADYRYYVLSDPEVSDKEYDSLMQSLKDLEKEYPDLISEDSPTQRISGGISEGFSTIRHERPMLSLDNTYSVEELKEWEKRVYKTLKNNMQLAYFVELKIDGVSAALTYEDGLFTLGGTRGDGEVGEDISSNLKTIKAIPLKLIGDNLPKRLEVRGEVYIGKEDFDNLNREKISKGEVPFANPRNAASGSLKLLNPSLVTKRNLRYFVHSYGVSKGCNFSSQEEFFKEAKKMGLPLNPESKLCRSLKEVIEYCLHWQERRNSLGYEVDGVVVKVNSFALQEKLGQTSRIPRWAVAYKFPGHQATTKVKEIIFGVGRTGVITPVALLKPVECGGVSISRATLHNFDEVKRLGVKEKDTVLIERAGDVIPKIIKVITSKRTGKEKAIKIPKNCPVCGGKVLKEQEGDVYWYCINPDCPAQLKRSLLHFASRGAMDIEGMGESVIEELVNRKLVEKITDIYSLKKEQLLSLPLFKDKRANNLIDSIRQSKTKPLSRFLYGLGIKHVGEKVALILADEFRDIDKFFDLSPEELKKIPEIGPIMSLAILEFFASPKIRKMVKELKRSGLSMVQNSKQSHSGKLDGKIFLFTGELDNFSRPQAQQLVEELGGRWVSSVSRNVNFLVAGRNPGSKYKKALEFGIRIVDEADFRAMLKD